VEVLEQPFFPWIDGRPSNEVWPSCHGGPLLQGSSMCRLLVQTRPLLCHTPPSGLSYFGDMQCQNDAMHGCAAQEAVAEEAATPKPSPAKGVQQEGLDAASRPAEELLSEWRVACSSWLQRARLLLERGGAKVLASRPAVVISEAEQINRSSKGHRRSTDIRLLRSSRRQSRECRCSACKGWLAWHRPKNTPCPLPYPAPCHSHLKSHVTAYSAIGGRPGGAGGGGRAVRVGRPRGGGGAGSGGAPGRGARLGVVAQQRIEEQARPGDPGGAAGLGPTAHQPHRSARTVCFICIPLSASHWGCSGLSNASCSSERLVRLERQHT